MNNLPFVLDVDDRDQVVELGLFLKNEKNAPITEELLTGSVDIALREVISKLEFAFTNQSEQDVEMMLNSVITNIVILEPDLMEQLGTQFCHKLIQINCTDRLNPVKVKCIMTFLNGLPDDSTLRYQAYLTLIEVARQNRNMTPILSDLDNLKTMTQDWKINTTQMQDLYRAMHQALVENHKSEEAGRVLIELLSTFTLENAAKAREDAIRCIVTSISDANTFLMDSLLHLKPVKFLEGEAIHSLLTIFVSGRLSDYLRFYEGHKDLIASLNLSHDFNVQKMRILTLMSMAENSRELKFEEIQTQLDLKDQEVEHFMIEAVRTQMIGARIDQMNRRITVHAVAQRTFGKAQWQALRQRLSGWTQSLTTVTMNLGSLQRRLAPPPHAMAHPGGAAQPVQHFS